MAKSVTLKKTVALLAVVLFFSAIDLGIFTLYTAKCIPDTSPEMQAKSITLEEYLPFAENSKIVKRKGSLALEGKLPVLDSAAALYPVSSAFVHALYPENSAPFNGADFAADSALRMNNTRNAYKAIVDGDTDIALLAKPSAEQLAYATEKGVELELTPVGCEAFVFLVHRDNPVDGLTVEQIKDIYTGKNTNWRDFGGKNKAIIPLQRNEGSGSQTAFLSFMDGEEAVRRSADPFGSCIGFSFRFYVEGVVQNGNVKMLSLNGVYPDRENISNKKYPIVSNFYAVHRKGDENPNVQKVIDWVLSDEGQSIIDDSGYVRLA